MEEIQPYLKIQKISDDLFVVDGEWYNTVFARRMTIIRLPSQELIIHSAIRFKDEDYQNLDQLGKVKYIVVPSKLHSSEARYYLEKYPDAVLYAPVDAMKAVGKDCKIQGFLPEAWPTHLKNEVSCLEIQGTRFFRETVFFHKKSKTLVLTDTVFNMQMEVKGLEKMIFKMINIYKKFGPSRSFKILFTKDWSAVQNSFREILHWDFDRVIMSHGEILQSGGKKAIQEGFGI